MTAALGVRAVLMAAMAAAFALALLVGTPYEARGWAIITVNSLADSGGPGICTLRDAIKAANTHTAVNGCSGGNGHDTIQFGVTGTITLAETLPDVTDSELTINGPASPGIGISGGGKVQVMGIQLGASVNLSNLTIANGKAPSGFENETGGGISNDGTLTVTNSIFSENFAGTAFSSVPALGGPFLTSVR
jgi:CSLREA domain-containing protein